MIENKREDEYKQKMEEREKERERDEVLASINCAELFN